MTEFPAPQNKNPPILIKDNTNREVLKGSVSANEYLGCYLHEINDNV